MQARHIAVNILNRIENTDAYTDITLAHELSGTNMSVRDRHFVTELVNGTIRWLLRLDWIIRLYFQGDYEKCPLKIRNVLRSALYQIMFLDKVPNYAAISEAVTLAKKLKGAFWGRKVNAILRSIDRNLDGIEYPDAKTQPVDYLAIKYSHPVWLVEKWYQRFGFDGTKNLLQYNNIPPKHTLRVNTLKISAQELQVRLREFDIETTISNFAGECLITKRLPNLDAFSLFQDGLFSIQDESAALVARLVDPKPGELILDLCAAPGGKTTHLAELSKNLSRIVAVDIYLNRLQLVKNAAQRLGHKSIFPVNADALQISGITADKVLIDAPCSGLGVLAKRSDARWKKTPEQLFELGILQKEILNNAAGLVKTGGYLIYSTCTIEPEENEQQVDRFLKEHPDFKIDFPADRFHRKLLKENNYIFTIPHIHNMDGSFATRFIKTG